MKRPPIIAALTAFAVVVAVVAAFVVLPGRGDALRVKKILIDVDPVAVAANVDREQVRGLITETLGDMRGVDVDSTAVTGAVVRVRIETFSTSSPPEGHDGQAGSSSLALAVEVLNGLDGKLIGRGHSVANARGLMAPDALVSQALRDAVQQVLAARAADSLDSDVLLSWLNEPSTSDGQRKKAMQALASRGERRATAPIVAVLETTPRDDEGNIGELSVAALQALAVLGDPDANDAVMAFSERQPAKIRKLCIDAVKASAAKQAVPWLFTLMWGHPDADVQAYARVALLSIAPRSLDDDVVPIASTVAGAVR